MDLHGGLPALGALGALGVAWRLSGSLAPGGLGYGRANARARSGEASTGATWASRRELRTLVISAPERGRLTVGIVKGRLVAAESRSSVLVVGPTQSMKTSGLAIPALLEWEGPVVAASVKSDLLRTTRDWRSRCGEVRVFDPTESTGTGEAVWSPLDVARSWAGARHLARSLAEVARSSSGLGDAEFWYATASKLLAPLLHAAAVSGRTMADVLRWLDEQEVHEVEAALEQVGASEALQAVTANWNRDERQRSAVYTTAETVVEAFADPLVSVSAGAPAGRLGAMDPSSFLDGCNTLYVCAPAHHQRGLRPVFATLISQVVEAAYERAQLGGAALDPPLLVLLDEAANVAPLAELDVLASTAAGHGVQLMTIWQDFAQLSARYGTRASSVINNHRAKLFLSGIADPQTLEHASQLIGEEQHPTLARTFDGQRALSTTESRVARRLLPPDALRRIRRGNAVLVSGNLAPARVELRPWHDDGMLRARSGAALADR